MKNLNKKLNKKKDDWKYNFIIKLNSIRIIT